MRMEREDPKPNVKLPIVIMAVLGGLLFALVIVTLMVMIARHRATPASTGESTSGAAKRPPQTLQEVRDVAQDRSPREVIAALGRPQSILSPSSENIDDPAYSADWHYYGLFRDSATGKPVSLWVEFKAGKAVRIHLGASY